MPEAPVRPDGVVLSSPGLYQYLGLEERHREILPEHHGQHEPVGKGYHLRADPRRPAS